jgi:hypothetical protein
MAENPSFRFAHFFKITTTKYMRPCRPLFDTLVVGWDQAKNLHGFGGLETMLFISRDEKNVAGADRICLSGDLCHTPAADNIRLVLIGMMVLRTLGIGLKAYYAHDEIRSPLPAPKNHALGDSVGASFHHEHSFHGDSFSISIPIVLEYHFILLVLNVAQAPDIGLVGKN